MPAAPFRSLVKSHRARTFSAELVSKTSDCRQDVRPTSQDTCTVRCAIHSHMLYQGSLAVLPTACSALADKDHEAHESIPEFDLKKLQSCLLLMLLGACGPTRPGRPRFCSLRRKVFLSGIDTLHIDHDLLQLFSHRDIKHHVRLRASIGSASFPYF